METPKKIITNYHNSSSSPSPSPSPSSAVKSLITGAIIKAINTNTITKPTITGTAAPIPIPIPTTTTPVTIPKALISAPVILTSTKAINTTSTLTNNFNNINPNNLNINGTSISIKSISIPPPPPSLTSSNGSLNKRTNKNQVIDNDGRSCFSSVLVKETGLNERANIPFILYKVHNHILKTKGDRKNKEKIADVGDTIYVFDCKCPDTYVFMVKSDFRTRNEVLWRRSSRDILDNASLEGRKCLCLDVTQRGEFGPKKSRSECFFVPFGVFHKSNNQTGVWISDKTYTEDMLPKTIGAQLNKGYFQAGNFSDVKYEPENKKKNIHGLLYNDANGLSSSKNDDDNIIKSSNLEICEILRFGIELFGSNPSTASNAKELEGYLEELGSEY